MVVVDKDYVASSHRRGDPLVTMDYRHAMKQSATERPRGRALATGVWALGIALCALATSLLTACEADVTETPVTKATDQKQVKTLPSAETNMVYEFEGWRDDFPYALHKPPRRTGEWYDRNRQQALEKVLQNVSGLCTKSAWLMSKEFFDRHMEESRDLLIEKLDETQRSTNQYDHAENLLNVIGRQANQGFAAVISRAIRHEHPGIRRASFRALVKAGEGKVVLDVFRGYPGLSKVERLDWIKSAAIHLPDADLFPLFRTMLTEQGYSDMFAHIFEAATKLEPKRAAKLFAPIWLGMVEDLKLHVAGVMHAAGDQRGTVLLKQAITPPIKIQKKKVVAIQGAEKGDPTPMLDELLQLTLEDNPLLNGMIIKAIRHLKEPRIDDILLTMTGVEKTREVRQFALLALRERGHTIELDQLVEVVKTEPEGTKYRSAIADLVGARYEKVVPVLLDRMKKATSKAEIFYIRMMARINQKASFPALKEVFMRPEYTLKWRERHSNVTIMGVQFSNLSSCPGEMLGLLAELPKSDYRRRASLVHALANLAGAQIDNAATAKPIYAALRKIVFDREDLPQMRILALDYLRKDIMLDDAVELRAKLPKEKTPMRQYLSDYLFEFF